VWRLACPNSPYDLIFPNLNGQPMSHSNLMTRGFHPALKRAGIRRIRFHDLRHTFASLMISPIPPLTMTGRWRRVRNHDGGVRS